MLNRRNICTSKTPSYEIKRLARNICTSKISYFDIKRQRGHRCYSTPSFAISLNTFCILSSASSRASINSFCSCVRSSSYIIRFKDLWCTYFPPAHQRLSKRLLGLLIDYVLMQYLQEATYARQKEQKKHNPKTVLPLVNQLQRLSLA